MVQRLNRQQKAILKEWFEKNGHDLKMGFHCTTDLPDDVYWRVHDLNDFQTLNEEIERFMDELISRATGSNLHGEDGQR